MSEAEVKDKVPSEAEQKAANKARLQKIERGEMLQREEEEAAKAQLKKQVQVTETAPMAEDFRLVAPRDRAFAPDARQYHDIACRGVSPEHALDSRYLWPVKHKLRLHDEVLLHDADFRWEVWARVMRFNEDLMLVHLSQITPIIKHDILPDARLDYSKVTIEHKGNADKWTVSFNRKKIKTGFLTQEEAEDWVRLKKDAA